ncbi:hypothetical protein [Polyangium jinanense]|uniref:Uncharacterized protein n=1 Tax=Polyangium jinanense TaxID=2829994 RepID=A0A9X3X2M3_9BACT|nr:hypothetical protein [Polyangium jinanense]MDC3958625.1 hypothetical protein [Polyangium jinanense]MDC3983067.1 hypothetical protein [Polyangium jinanense]
MSATDSSSAEPARGRRTRIVVAALLVISALGLAAALVSYRQYAAVWLRPPPRLPPCVPGARRMLMHEEPVTGSIPHVTPEGSTVYLRPSEDRALSCLGRVSSKVASAYAGAFAEIEPTARARALAAVMKNLPQDASADREALAAWMLSSAAMRALPETPETTAARDEIDQMNACRFAMRSTCPTRPSIPIVVWAAGVPSSLGLLFGAGLGVRALVRLVRARRRRKAA